MNAERRPGHSPGSRAIPRRSLTEAPVVLRNLVAGAMPAGLAEYDVPSGDEILDALERARLRSRGDDSSLTAARWRVVRETPAEWRYVVANGVEGEPGSLVDRLLMEEDPHAILAGMATCARAIDASRGIVCVPDRYSRARESLRAAIEQARAAGRLGGGFDVDVIASAGFSACGDQAVLLRTIGGRDGARFGLDHLAEARLHGLPTVVESLETLAIVPWVARHAGPTGTKAMSLLGAIRQPGVVEAPLGVTLRRVLSEAGGGPPEGHRWRMALVGGPVGRVIPERQFDVPLSYEILPGLGHAGIVVLDECVTPRALAEHLFESARLESCGACAPCRLGTARLAAIMDEPAMRRLLATLEMGSLCEFGRNVPRPIHDLLEHFGSQVLA